MVSSRRQEKETEKSNTQIISQLIDTVNSTTVKGKDRNHDGIPDYLQREEIPSIIKGNKDYNQWDVDTTREVEEWLRGLQGYELDATKMVYKPVSPPIMNHIGINAVSSHIKSAITKHSINTELKFEEVHRLVKSQAEDLMEWFGQNRKKADISNSDRTSIVREFDDMAFIILSRSINDKNRQHATDRTRITNSSQSGPMSPV